MKPHARELADWSSVAVTTAELESASRSAAVAADAASNRSIELAGLWRELRGGRTRIVSSFLTDTRCFLVLEDAQAPLVDRRLSTRKVQLLERILLGEGQKAVALALGVAASTVTLISSDCLKAMGLECRSSRVPLMLVMAAHASRGALYFAVGRQSQIEVCGRPHRVVSAPRPDELLPELLSPAECAVTRLLVEGKCHADISTERRTSTRTIANQLAAAFNKLGVSGRSELLSRLVTLPPAGRSGAAVTPPSVVDTPLALRARRLRPIRPSTRPRVATAVPRGPDWAWSPPAPASSRSAALQPQSARG